MKNPNVQIIKVTVESDLDVLLLPAIAQHDHIFPNINHSLVSIGSLCDSGCTVTFKTKDFIVIYKDEITL